MRNAPAHTLAVLAVAGAVVAASLLGGCGASALKTHARTALMLRSANDAAVGVLESGCERRAVAAASNPDVDHAQASADAAAILGRCETAVSAQHAFASALNIYIDHLLAAVDSGDESPTTLDRLLTLLHGLVPLYGDLVRVASALGIHLPDVPGPLRALMEVD